MIVNKRNRWIYTGVTVIILIAVALMLFTAPPITVAEDDNIPAMLTSSVMDDLQSATIDGEKFDIKDYPRDDTANVRVITFQEFGYGYYSSEYYGLYFYIYNPTQREINAEGLNKITFATAYTGESATTYAKFDLEIVSVSKAPYANRFYKLRVKDPSRILSRIGERSESRRYDVSELELNFGASTAEAFEVGGKFVFSGYSAGLGENPEAESTLTCTFTPIETVLITGLSDRQTVYRSDMDNSNMQSHNQVNSVYFAIDNRLIEEYGVLQKIEAEWWEYRTTPIIVTNNEELYNCLLPMRGEIIDGHNCDYDWGLGVYKDGNLTGTINNYSWTYNIRTFSSLNGNGTYSDEEESKLSWILRTAEWDESIDNYVIDSDTLEKYIKAYENEAGTHFATDNGYRYCSDLFDTDVGSGRKAGYNHTIFDAEDPEDMINFKEYDPEYGGWDLFKHIFGWEDTFDEVLKDQTPILTIDSTNRSEYLSGSDEDIANRLLIDVNDVSAFKDYVSNSLNANQTVVLFRFACTEYYSEPLDARKYSEHTFHVSLGKDDISFIAEENVFLNFDIMSLTFNKDGVFTVIPVVSSPIDIVSDIVGPALPDSLGDIIMYYILLVVMILASALVLFVLYKILWGLSKSIMKAVPGKQPANYNNRRKRRR